MTATLNLPAVLSADDYHEFDYIQKQIKMLGVDLKFKETGYYGMSYNAVFYTTLDEKVKQLIEEEEKKSL